MNEHIESYCREYIESDNSPDFAVFLKGDWGCGKTYFINKLMEKYTDCSGKLKKSEILYLSLFGVAQKSDIDDLIFQKIHPVLSSKQFKIASAVIQSALRLGLNFDYNKDGKSDGTLSLGGFGADKKKKIYLKDLSKKLIIVDDIERTSLSPFQIFGYFSEYLYQLDTKIIFIGNEEHIASKEDTQKNEYHKIKEKTIGIEFSVKPEIESALNSFIKELSFRSEKPDFIIANSLEAMQILECNNLRTVRQCLYNLNILQNSLGEDAFSKHGSEITKIFMNLFIQKSLNFITDGKQIYEAIIGYEKYRCNYKKYEEQKTQKKEDSFLDGLSIYIPLSSCWEEIIFDGNYSKDYLTKEYNKEVMINEPAKQKNLFLLINNWRNMDKKDFTDIIEKIETDFETGIYLHPGEILHYLNIMLIFSGWGLIKKSSDEITESVMDTIEKYKSRIPVISDWGMLEVSYAGWSYNDSFQEIRDVRSLLKKITENNRQILAKKYIDEDIKNMANNIVEFCRNLVHVNGTNRYYKIPFLHLANIESFFDGFVNLDVADQSSIISALEERYGKIYRNGDVYKEENMPDKEKLIKLTKLYDDSLGEIVNNPKELMKKDISKRFHELVEYFG